jgi:hypothetical protein
MLPMKSRVPLAIALAAVVAGGAVACAPLDTLEGGAPAPPRASTIEGEVRSVDTHFGRLEIRERDGWTHTVRFDRGLQVIYGQRRYPVTSLERGDVVRLRVAHDRGALPVAERVELRRDVRELSRTVRTARLEGTIAQVDLRGGRFSVQPRSGRAVTVYLPRDVRLGDARRFERLRRGERVTLEVQPRSNTEAVLVRFR